LVPPAFFQGSQTLHSAQNRRKTVKLVKQPLWLCKPPKCLSASVSLSV
jgi:hypothetical protein